MKACVCNPARAESSCSSSLAKTPGGALDYFICEVAPHGGPPLHVHHNQDEAIHVLSGRFKVRIGDQEYTLDSGGFAYLPAGLPHAFLNLTDQPADLIIVFTPGGGHKFFEELGPATRTATFNRDEVAAIFERHGMTLLGRRSAPTDQRPPGQTPQAHHKPAEASPPDTCLVRTAPNPRRVQDTRRARIARAER